jgi:hypothetical protein
MLSRVRAIVRDRLRPNRSRRRAKGPRLLAAAQPPDPRLHETSVDPNARFLGEQMGNG